MGMLKRNAEHHTPLAGVSVQCSHVRECEHNGPNTNKESEILVKQLVYNPKAKRVLLSYIML